MKRMRYMDQMDRINIYVFFFERISGVRLLLPPIFIFKADELLKLYVIARIDTVHTRKHMMPLCSGIALLLGKKRAQIHNSGKMVVISTIVG